MSRGGGGGELRRGRAGGHTGELYRRRDNHMFSGKILVVLSVICVSVSVICTEIFILGSCLKVRGVRLVTAHNKNKRF